jgi:hypothetical protein
VSRPVAGLDRADCRILKRLNEGPEAPTAALRNRIDKLLDSGFVEEKGYGEVTITLRGQLELARWRFRSIPKPKFVVWGPDPHGSVIGRFFKSSS